MLYKIKVCIGILFGFLFNCQAQKPFNEHYICLKTLNKQIREGEWKLEQYFKAIEKDFYSFYMSDKDTLYNLTFYVKAKNTLILCQSDYLITEFRKKYSDSNYEYVLLMNTDTLYFYKSPLCNSRIKIFTVGKYYYLYSTPNEMKNFKLCQFEFFQEHFDSLIRVRGDTLPELPCIKEN